VAPGGPLRQGQIFDINSYSIAAAVRECKAHAVSYGILPDRGREMSKAIMKMAVECDIILVSGSTSAGAGDMVYRVLEDIGETVFHGVNLKPGKPTIFGMVGGTPCLGLPGYPTSALIVFELLAAPAIGKALGLRHQGRYAKGRLAGHIRTEGRQQMMAAGISGDLIYPVDKGSGSITTLAWADGVIEIPAHVEYLEKGEVVNVRLLGDQEAPDLILAGENTVLLENLENDSLQVRLMNIGSNRGRMLLEDGIADIACVSGDLQPTESMAVIMSYNRELGLVSKDSIALQDIGEKRMVGWHKDSKMRRHFENALQNMGIANPTYSRIAKTHSTVAATIAADLADLGFAERDAAKQAGLIFRPLTNEGIHFLVRSDEQPDSALISFISSLQRANAGR
jgi:putative molybdopterin biosynthesis protein